MLKIVSVNFGDMEVEAVLVDGEHPEVIATDIASSSAKGSPTPARVRYEGKTLDPNFEKYNYRLVS
jgi:hypothetical protein